MSLCQYVQAKQKRKKKERKEKKKKKKEYTFGLLKTHRRHKTAH
jgi:hypothetical protein